MEELRVNDYIDWKAMFKNVRGKHLNEFPTVDDYRTEMVGTLENTLFADEMYSWLLDREDELLSDFMLNDVEDDVSNYLPYGCRCYSRGNLIFDFSQSKDASTENGYDETGCSYTFEYDTEMRCFVNFTHEAW